MMENNHYEYIKTLISLYTDDNYFSYGGYSECAICIIENNGVYTVALGERGHYHFEKQVKTPNEAAYAALKMVSVESQTTDFERIRDKFLEKNINYVEKLLKDEEFLKTIPEISKHFDWDSLKMMTIFSIVELGDGDIDSKILDNKMRFLVAALLAKKPEEKIKRK